jgi:dTDP-4-dehydrorhamnose reductase
MFNVALIGANGMLGRELAGLLRARGIAFVGLDLPELDITSPPSLADCDELQKAEIIFNCAAYTNVEKAEVEEELATAINGAGVRNLARLAKDNGAYLLHISTDFVFDGNSARPYLPDDQPAPLSAYGRSKLAGEIALAETGGTWAILRTAWLYGIHGRNFVETMLSLAAKNGRLDVVDDQTGSPTMTLDLAGVMLSLAEKKATGVYHCVNAGTTTWCGFAREIVKQAGLDVPVYPLTAAQASEKFNLKAVRPAYSVLDCGGLENVTHGKMRDWHEALVDYLSRRETAKHGN